MVWFKIFIGVCAVGILIGYSYGFAWFFLSMMKRKQLKDMRDATFGKKSNITLLQMQQVAREIARSSKDKKNKKKELEEDVMYR